MDKHTHPKYIKAAFEQIGVRLGFVAYIYGYRICMKNEHMLVAYGRGLYHRAAWLRIISEFKLLVPELKTASDARILDAVDAADVLKCRMSGVTI